MGPKVGLTDFDFNKVVELAFNEYEFATEKCLENNQVIAGLVTLRAALEASLIAVLLLQLMHISEKEREELQRDFGLVVYSEKSKVRIENFNREDLTLHQLIEQVLCPHVNKSVCEAAHRIREWGNYIHASRFFDFGSKPFRKPSTRNLKARLKDWELVKKALLRELI